MVYTTYLIANNNCEISPDVAMEIRSTPEVEKTFTLHLIADNYCEKSPGSDSRYYSAGRYLL